MINPDIDYLKNQINMSGMEINLFLEAYSKPYVANLTFDSYQEAAYYKQLWIFERPNSGGWFKATLECNSKKIELPLNIKDIARTKK